MKTAFASRQVGHYRLLERLGAGGMGEVYRAEDCLLRRQVALKILSPDRAAQPLSLERFQREARSVAALNHPGIVTIFSVEEHDGLHFLTMEMVHGRTLTEHIPAGGLPLRRFLEIAVPLAEALEAAHEQDIVHRDLKPDNVMVSPEGRVKVLDFGIAKPEPAEETIVEGESPAHEDLTQTGTVLGTVPYMSPEQIIGRRVDHRTDLFSLGVFLFEMATGQHPFRGGNREATLAAILRHTPPLLSSLNPQIPAVLDEIVAGCLEKNVSRRTQSAREVRQRLQSLAAGLALPSPSKPETRWQRRTVMLVAAGCLALFVAAAGLSLSKLWTDNNPAPELSGEHQPSLAVLPLGNYSADPEYFVDGMTDALISSLSELRGVRVISRQSVMRFKGSSEPLPEIAHQLGVEMILQGAVMHEGGRVRITVQLLRAIPEQQIWSRSYERDLRDLLSLQHEIALAISGEIKAKVEPSKRSRLAIDRPIDPETYDFYLRGRQELSQRSRNELEEAARHFQAALDRDPRFVLAHTGLAALYVLEASYGMSAPPDAYREARTHSKAALAINPDQAEAHTVLGLIQFLADRDWDTAEASLRRAIDLNPNQADAHYYLWLYLLLRGRRAEATREIHLARDLDPLSPSIAMNLGLESYLDGRDQDAEALLQKAATLAPDFRGPFLYLSNLYGRQGRSELAFQSFRKSLELQYPEIKAEVDRAYKKGGRTSALKAAARSLDKLSHRRLVAPDDIARVYLRLGDINRSLDYLEEAYERGFPGVVILDATGGWESLRSVPRYQALMKRIG